MTRDLEAYLDAYLDAYLTALAGADTGEALAVLRAATHRGIPARQLVREVLVPAQRRVGELWYAGAWSVADEHAATAVSEQALSLLSAPGRPRPAAVQVAVACAQGEWHTLPARLAAELARTPGVDVVVLGGGVRVEDLGRHLRASSTDVLALSCTMPTNLLGAARSIAVARAEGVPVVVGGRAWGSGQHRAERLGADLHLEDPAGLGEALATLPRPGAEPAPLPAEALVMDAPPRELLLLALERQQAAGPGARGTASSWPERDLEDLVWLARHAAAAVACDDPTVVGDLLRWRLGLPAPEGASTAAVLDGCDYLADVLEPTAPRCAQVLRDQAVVVRRETAH